MRTLNQDGRRYNVSGDVVFEFNPSRARKCPDGVIQKLREAIVQTDTLHPWRDLHFPSIQLIGDPNYYSYESEEKCFLRVSFRIFPSMHVRKGQVHCYEKYLETLAQKLAEQSLGVTAVLSALHVYGMSQSFRAG